MDEMITREKVPPGASEARVSAAMRVIILDNVDPRTAGVFHAFRAATDLHHQTMQRRLAQHCSHPGEALCLRLVVNQDGIKQSELADILRRSRPWITKILQSLESEGHVVRRTDDRDQRVTRVYITPSGRAREAELYTVWTDFLNQTMGCLSEQDQLDLERLLKELAGRIEDLVLEDPELSTQ